MDAADEETKKKKEEQKQTITREYNKQKQDIFEQALKDATVFEYNANVFKNVKLDMTEEEIKKEEENIRQLQTYLNDV